MFFDRGLDPFMLQSYRVTSVSSFEQRRDCVVPVRVYFCSAHHSKGFCTLYMTLVYDSLLPAEVMCVKMCRRLSTAFMTQY